jgi:hypothetical protein
VPRSETSAKDEAKHNKEKGLEGVAAQQNKVRGEKAEIRIEARTTL